MYVNHRDEISHHAYMKALRKKCGINRERVAKGICSGSEYSKFENGDRLPEKLMRDRLMARLGTSADEFEEYLRFKEYQEWQLRIHILDCVNKKNMKGVLDGIAALEENPNPNPVQMQFIETMRYLLLQMMSAEKEKLQKQINLAVSCTIPSVEAALSGAHPLADQELNLLMEYYLICPVEEGAEENIWRWNKFQMIEKYVDNASMDLIGRAKVYPRLASLVSELALQEKATVEQMRSAHDTCLKAVDALRETARLYYFVEVLEYKQKLVQRMMEAGMPEADLCLLKFMAENEAGKEQLLKMLYNRYDQPMYTENFTYFYIEGEVHCVEDVIDLRRRMRGLSYHKLASGICSERTVARIVARDNEPSMMIVRELFERLGICGEYKRARVIAGEPDIVALANEVAFYINGYNYERGKIRQSELEERLNKSGIYNQQELISNRILLKAISNQKWDERDLNEAIDALELTMPVNAAFCEGDKYFTRVEMELICNLAFVIRGKQQASYQQLVYELCEFALMEGIQPGQICIYELMFSYAASELQKNKEEEKAEEYRDFIIRESMRHYRFGAIPSNLTEEKEKQKLNKLLRRNAQSAKIHTISI